MRIVVLAMTAMLSLGGCETKPAATPAAPLVLDPHVQQSVAAALRDYRSPISAARLVAERTIAIKAGAGGTVNLRYASDYVLLDSGLWGTAGTSAANEGRSKSVFQNLTLCGLAFLLSSTLSANTMEIGTPLNVRGIFLPFGVRSTQQTGRQLRVTAFEAPAGLCAPTPGQSFTYRITTAIDMASSGLFGTASSASGTAEVTCRMAAATRPARQLGIAMSGEALLARCEQGGAQRSERRDYAYLPAAGFYVLLREDVPEHTATVRYEAVSFGPG